MKCDMKECEQDAIENKLYCVRCNAEMEQAHAEWSAARNDREARMKREGRCVSCEELFDDVDGQSDEEPTHCVECWDEACEAGGHVSQRMMERAYDQAKDRRKYGDL